VIRRAVKIYYKKTNAFLIALNPLITGKNKGILFHIG
jgi:hypothetical protein